MPARQRPKGHRRPRRNRIRHRGADRRRRHQHHQPGPVRRGHQQGRDRRRVRPHVRRDPDTLLKLSKLKSGTGFNTPLLGVDATSPTKRSILGVPITWSPAVTATDIWDVPRSKSFVVIRTGTTLVTDSSAYSSSDRTAVRCTMRVGFAWPHAAALVKIHIGA